jgi:general secretion pathway protein C
MKLQLSSLLSKKRGKAANRLPTSHFDADSYTQTTMFRNSALQGVATFLVKWSVWFQIRMQPLLVRLNWQIIKGATLVLAVSFVGASVVSTYSAKIAFSLFARPGRANTQSPAAGRVVGHITTAAKGSSARALEELILKRNLFNSEGTLAPDGKGETQSKDNSLDFEAVACTNEKLPVEVLGTIFTGDATKSFVAIKDPKIQDADIYKVGDIIIDNEEIEVWRVKQGVAEFRRGDTKICVDIAGRSPKEAAPAAPAARPDAIETIDLADSELKNLLGPELARAMNEAKLVPDAEPGTGQLLGYRLLAIVPGSVFDRIKLQNEDLIAEVNGVSMKDPTQGFRLLEALQQQREITVNFTRKGEPMVRKVRVK